MTQCGVAYEVSIPRRVFERLPKLGEPVEMRTHQVFREDGSFLFGFLDDAERATFARLLTASGVGPKLALALLSALPPERLARAVRERDIVTLTGVSGVGRKTAERLVLDLSGKLDDLPFVAESSPSGPGVEEALRALTVLGYGRVEAEAALRKVGQDARAGGTQELIRAALAQLG